MLNYVWSGLIIISIIFAMSSDVYDEFNNTYNNGVSYEISYISLQDETRFKYNDIEFTAELDQDTLKISIDEELPTIWKNIVAASKLEEPQHLQATILTHDTDLKNLQIIFPEIHWQKLNALISAAFDMAKFAVTLAIGLAGLMALWLGLMHIAEKSGLIYVFVRLIRPLLNWLFPDVPKDHPALGSISLNMAANVLGLGNAATPLGIRAMQQLQELNQKKDQASDSMCMFLALNTSSVQLLPPVTLIAIMGFGVSELIIPIIMATSVSTIVAIIVAKSYARRSNLS